MIAVDRSQRPVPGPPSPFRFPAVRQVTLDGSGLDVRLVTHRSAPVVSVAALVRGGVAADPVDRHGLAAFTADLLDDGAGDFDGPGLADALARIGAEADIEVWPDATLVTITTLARHAPRAFALLGDLVRRPRFDESDVARVRELRLDRLRQLRAQAATQADHVFTRTIYGPHPYGHPGIGDAASLRATTSDDIRAMHARTFRPESMTLVVVGDVGNDAALRVAEETFGDWTAAAMTGRPEPEVDALPARGTLVVVPRPGAPQSELRVGHVAAARSTPDYHALLLWNAALGGQFVSRLNMTLRQAKGYTYGVRSGFDFRRRRGPFSIHTSVQASATGDAVREILEGVRGMLGAQPMSAQELTRARAAVGLGYPRGFETAQQIGRAVAHASLHDLPSDAFERFVPCLDAATLDDIAAAAARHVQVDRLTAVVVGDPEVVEASLAEVGLASTTAGEA